MTKATFGYTCYCYMDRLTAEILNILIPANQVEETIENIQEVMSASDVDSELEDNLLKAELYVAEICQQNLPLSIAILSNISKIIYSKMYAWAGKVDPVKRNAIERVLNRVASQWEYSLIDEEVRLELLAYAYHGVLKSKPFFDGNEKVARLFINYMGLRQNLPIFTVSPSKKDVKSYKKYLKELKMADEGDLLPLKERIRAAIYMWSVSNDYVELGPSATVSD